MLLPAQLNVSSHRLQSPRLQRCCGHHVLRQHKLCLAAAAQELHPAGTEIPDKTLDESAGPARQNAVMWEYAKESNPFMSPVPVQSWGAELHEGDAPSEVVHLDLSEDLNTDGPATSPNCLASFVRVTQGDRFRTHAQATSQAFYVIRGQGESTSGESVIRWSAGHVFVLPGDMAVSHYCTAGDDRNGSAALYWVTDEPLCRYLGVKPCNRRFEPVHFTHAQLEGAVKELQLDPESTKKNRVGVLLGTKQTTHTKTLTHTLWMLYNVLPAGSVQAPHRHAATALDLAVHAPEGTYTMMAQELDDQGHLIDPVKVPWAAGGVFTTPPGWWHSHHNDSDADAWVAPFQDAGLLTGMRVLNIRFADQEAKALRAHKERGSTVAGQTIKV